jgi:hypothetical protein
MRDVFAKRLLNQLIKLATESLYSEQFDFDEIVNKMSRNKQGVHLLRAYVAVQTATRLLEPLCDADVDRAFSVLRDSEQHADSPQFADIVDVHAGLAKLYWRHKQRDILKGKLAHQLNENSFAGTIYRLECDKKGPTTSQERATFEPLCAQMAEIDRKIEDSELAAMKDANDPSYSEAKAEIELRGLRDEVTANEDEALTRDLLELTTVFQNRLKVLMLEGNGMAQQGGAPDANTRG